MTPRRYSKVSRRIWNDAKFRSLSAPQPNAQTLFLRLLTGPELTNIPGLIPVGEAALAEALGWPLEGFREAFREVFREGLAEGDWEARLVFVPKAIFHNEPESPNVIKAWAPAWDEAPECDLKTRAWEALRDYAKAKGSGWLEAFDKACPKPSGKAIEKASAKASPKPSANQEQEQEQEQEQKFKSPNGLSSECGTPTPKPDPVRLVFDAWLKEHVDERQRSKCKLNGKRRTKIQQRLREGYEPERLIAAIRGAALDDFIMGRHPKTEGKKYNGLETILRDGSQVEKFEALLEAPPPPPGRKRPSIAQPSPASAFDPEGSWAEFERQLAAGGSA